MKTNERITLQENGDVVRLSLTKTETDIIESCGRYWKTKLGLRRPPFILQQTSAGTFVLRTVGITGVIRIGRYEFEIMPKFLDDNHVDWQIALWKILTIAGGGLVSSNSLHSSNSDERTLIELFADTFIESFSRGTSKGLPQRYHTFYSSGKNLHGSLDFSRINQLYIRPWDYPYLIDSLTPDTPLASLLRWAAIKLSQAVKSQERIRSLRNISSSLSFVKTPTPDVYDARKIRLESQYRELENALKIAVILLEGSGASYSIGTTYLSGFVWNSDVVFENFMFNICKYSGRTLHLTVSKHPYAFGKIVYGEDASQLETIPDIVFSRSDGSIVAVADAKYKKYGAKPRTSDVYQVLSDANILGTPQASLLYPVSRDYQRKTWEITSQLGGESVCVSMLPVNLAHVAKPKGIEVLADVITDWLRCSANAEVV